MGGLGLHCPALRRRGSMAPAATAGVTGVEVPACASEAEEPEPTDCAPPGTAPGAAAGLPGAARKRRKPDADDLRVSLIPSLQFLLTDGGSRGARPARLPFAISPAKRRRCVGTAASPCTVQLLPGVAWEASASKSHALQRDGGEGGAEGWD